MISLSSSALSSRRVEVVITRPMPSISGRQRLLYRFDPGNGFCGCRALRCPAKLDRAASGRQKFTLNISRRRSSLYWPVVARSRWNKFSVSRRSRKDQAGALAGQAHDCTGQDGFFAAATSRSGARPGHDQSCAMQAFGGDQSDASAQGIARSRLAKPGADAAPQTRRGG
jgi:hypothetical protein